MKLKVTNQNKTTSSVLYAYILEDNINYTLYPLLLFELIDLGISNTHIELSYFSSSYCFWEDESRITSEA